MDKKEINSPNLTANFLFWVCGVGGLLPLALLGAFALEDFLSGLKLTVSTPCVGGYMKTNSGNLHCSDGADSAYCARLGAGHR